VEVRGGGEGVSEEGEIGEILADGGFFVCFMLMWSARELFLRSLFWGARDDRSFGGVLNGDILEV
jgi:hypothetical protein